MIALGVTPGRGSGAAITAPSPIGAAATGAVAQLRTSIKGALTWSKLSGPASIAVSAAGVLSLSAALGAGGSAVATVRVQNTQGDAAERAITLRALAAGPAPTPTPTPVPSPPVGVYSLPSTVQGGEAGKGFTCTGLARDPLDGTWWVGNDGRARGGSTPAGTVVHLSPDFTTVLAEFTAASFGLVAGHSCQGVTMVGARVAALFKKPGTGTTAYDACVLFERDGTLVSKATTTSSTSDYNGLGYDTSRQQLISSTGTGVSWRGVTDFVAVAPTKAYAKTDIDQLAYVADGDTVLTTGGANGADGTVIRYRAADFVEIARTTLAASTAIEGIVEFDGKWAVCSDGWFHNGGTDLNVVRVYNRPI